MNKTVQMYLYNVNGCRMTYETGNKTGSDETVKINACEEKIDSMPKIYMSKSDADSTKFSMKHVASVHISGSDSYIKQCLLATILSKSNA